MDQKEPGHSEASAGPPGNDPGPARPKEGSGSLLPGEAPRGREEDAVGLAFPVWDVSTWEPQLTTSSRTVGLLGSLKEPLAVLPCWCKQQPDESDSENSIGTSISLPVPASEIAKLTSLNNPVQDCMDEDFSLKVKYKKDTPILPCSPPPFPLKQDFTKSTVVGEAASDPGERCQNVICPSMVL